MMQKQISNKKIIIYVCAAVAVIAAAVIVFLLNREETFRSILVYEVDGTALIERDGIGSMNAAENLYLESGDQVSVAQDSSMRMRLDDDKYVMAEAETIFSVEAAGTDKNSRTRIRLEQGAITNEIRNPLSEGSQYETSTPNAVMAVRGTIYRVELYMDENGGKTTKVSCFQGKVGATPILSDGSFGEEILVPAGCELIIYSDGTVEGPVEIRYQKLSKQSLLILRGLLENGQSMEGITLDELTGIMEDVSEESEEIEPEQTLLPKETSGQGDEDTDTAKNSSAQPASNVKNSGTSKSKAAQPEQKTQLPEETQPEASAQAAEPSPVIENTVESVPQDGNTSDTSGNDSEPDHNEPDENRPDDNTPNESRPSQNKPDHNRPSAGVPEEPPETAVYTVTFKCGGVTFATQEVKSGERASRPRLNPAVSGDWNFDFGTEITADITVEWK